MFRRIICAVLAAVSVIILFSSCSETNGATLTGYAFAEAIAKGNYSEAYDLCYFSERDYLTEEEFCERYENIYGALEVTGISVQEKSVTESETDNCYDLQYTLDFSSTLLGDFTYSYTALVMPDVSGYSVEFTPALILPYMETGDTVRVETIEGKRGEMFAQDKILLAENSYADTVYMLTDEIESIDTTASALETLTGVSASDITDDYNNAVEKGYDIVTVRTYVRDTLTDDEISTLMAVDGVYIDSDSLTPVRYYSLQDATAHLLGYCSGVSEEDISANPELESGDLTGRSGLELSYNDLLTGSDGRKIYVQDSAGAEKYVIYEEEARDGTDINLTIDAGEQSKAYTALASYLEEGQSGCVIELDYTTGAVKAGVSYPSFDPNWFAVGITSDQWDYLNSEESDSPLYNRLTQATYPPGSTFKVFSCVPALENGLIDPEQIVELDITDNKWIPDSSLLEEGEQWVYPAIVRSEETKGDYTLMNAIKSSDNIFLAYVALITGKEEFTKYLERIGMDSAVSFEIPVTSAKIMNEGEEFTPHLLATSGYGMGQLQLTALQLAAMYTCFENDGDILNPYMIESLAREENGTYQNVSETQPSVFRENIMETSTIETLKSAMRLVVTNGTAYQLGMGEYNIYGKTGTATLVSSGENSREVNWIVLISKEKGNEKLVLVMVDSKADEGDNKFSIARDMIYPDKEYIEENSEGGEESEASAGTDSSADDTGEMNYAE